MFNTMSLVSGGHGFEIANMPGFTGGKPRFSALFTAWYFFMEKVEAMLTDTKL